MANKQPAKTSKQLRAFSASAEVDAIRTEIFNGKEYTVVPVVALVEGVIQGMNAKVPEYAPASAFGKFPASWNGRPLVLNHPTDTEGNPISANSIVPLEENAFGMILNSKIEGGKLKTEAWIDNEIVANKGGDFQEVVDRLNNNETLEVSTGCFVSSLARRGTFNSKPYQAVWVEVVPDHLAFLPNSTGACSIEDGCGAPRTNEQSLAPKANCSCGGKDTTKGQGTQAPTEEPNVQEGSVPIEVVTKLLESLSSKLNLQAVSPSLLSTDIRKQIQEALWERKSTSATASSSYYGGGCWLVGFTTDMAIYEDTDPKTGHYDTYQIAYNIDDNGVVTFTGEPQEVSLITRVVAVQQLAAQIQAQADSEETDMDPKTQTGTNQGKPAKPTDQANQSDATQVAANQPAPKDNKNQVREILDDHVEPKNVQDQLSEKQPMTLQQYIESAPPEIREVLSDQMRTHKEKKDHLTGQLKASGRCEFTDQELSAMSTKQLERLCKLAQVPSFEGQAFPSVQSHSQAPKQDDYFAPAPSIFEGIQPRETPLASRKH